MSGGCLRVHRETRLMATAEAFRQTEKRRRHATSSYRDLPKHYVRKIGWLPVLRKYATARAEGPRYFTLCAKEAIDVRYFRQCGVLPFNPKERSYPTVTFVEREAQDYASIAEMLGQTRLGLLGDLEAIVLRPADFPDEHRRLLATFPYDVVNLDFTGEVVRPKDPPYSNTLKAIEKLVELQSNYDLQRWHMFLTFRAAAATTSGPGAEQLCELLKSNLVDDEAKKAYGTRPSPTKMFKEQFSEVIRLGAAKVVAAKAAGCGFRMAIHGSYRYRRRPTVAPSYDIVKLILVFDRTRDTTDIPDLNLDSQVYRECVPDIFNSKAINVRGRLKGQLKESVRNDLAQFLE